MHWFRNNLRASADNHARRESPTNKQIRTNPAARATRENQEKRSAIYEHCQARWARSAT